MWHCGKCRGQNEFGFSLGTWVRDTTHQVNHKPQDTKKWNGGASATRIAPPRRPGGWRISFQCSGLLRFVHLTVLAQRVRRPDVQALIVWSFEPITRCVLGILVRVTPPASSLLSLLCLGTDVYLDHIEFYGFRLATHSVHMINSMCG